MSDNTITHGTIHGHIHTFGDSHRHIHGHIHKHQHTLPANIDARLLQQPTGERNDSSVDNSVDKIVEIAGAQVQPMAAAPASAVHCQIQQIIDQCYLNTLESCFECSENYNEMQKNELLGQLCDSCDELSSDIECCADDHCSETAIATPRNLSTTNIDVTSLIQSLLDNGQDPFGAQFGQSKSASPVQEDKCFEFCDFDKLVDAAGAGGLGFAANGASAAATGVVTDVPDSPSALYRPATTPANISNVRTDPQHKLHTQIHSHDTIEHCPLPLRIDHVVDHVTKRRRTGAAPTSSSLSKVEKFNYNWIDLNGAAPLPLVPSSKNHIHCLWTDCDRTLKELASNDELQQHIWDDHLQKGLSQSSNELQCNWIDCDFKTADMTELLQHVPKEHGIGASQEPLCRRPGHRHLHHHELHHHHQRTSPVLAEPEEHRCLWEMDPGAGPTVNCCNIVFNSTQELNDHVLLDHIGGGRLSYVCKWQNCSRNERPFNQKQKVVRHLHIHTKHRPLECKVCGKRFSIDLMLEQHMRIHTGERPFQCSICAKWFKTSSSLSIHLRVHSGEKPMVCKYPGCGKRFNESSNLTKHHKVHERKFKCCHCTRTFNLEKQLVNHLKLYHGLDETEYEVLKLQHGGFLNQWSSSQARVKTEDEVSVLGSVAS